MMKSFEISFYLPLPTDLRRHIFLFKDSFRHLKSWLFLKSILLKVEDILHFLDFFSQSKHVVCTKHAFKTKYSCCGRPAGTTLHFLKIFKQDKFLTLPCICVWGFLFAQDFFKEVFCLFCQHDTFHPLSL